MAKNRGAILVLAANAFSAQQLIDVAQHMDSTTVLLDECEWKGIDETSRLEVVEVLEVVSLPRVRHTNSYPTWHARFNPSDLAASLDKIQAQIQTLHRDYNFRVMLVDQDNGLLEATLIHVLKAMGVPSVFVCHGVPPKAPSDLFPRIRNNVRRIKSKLLFPSLAIPRASGRNGAEIVCSSGHRALSTLRSNRTPKAIIRQTGWVYGDRIFTAMSELTYPEPEPSVLVTSGAAHHYGKPGMAAEFYENLLAIGKSMQGIGPVTLRTKTMEQPEREANGLWPAILSTGVRLDNSGSSLAAIKQHTAVAAEPWSTILLESALLGRPTYTIGHSQSGSFVEKLTSLQSVDSLIRDPKDALEDREYGLQLKAEALDNVEFFFHQLDGKSALRTARVIQEHLDGV